MSDTVKRCGAYIARENGWPVMGGCKRPGIGEGGLCKEHAAGRKRSEKANDKFDAKRKADDAEDAKRTAAFRRFITEMDGSKAVKSGTLAVYNEIREHLRMQMVSMRGYVIGPQEKETK